MFISISRPFILAAFVSGGMVLAACSGHNHANAAESSRYGGGASAGYHGAGYGGAAYPGGAYGGAAYQGAAYSGGANGNCVGSSGVWRRTSRA